VASYLVDKLVQAAAGIACRPLPPTQTRVEQTVQPASGISAQHCMPLTQSAPRPHQKILVLLHLACAPCGHIGHGS
jgi:hypothetical protein